MCHSWGATACAHVQGSGRSRSRERLNRSRSNLVNWWGSVSKVACKSKLRPTLYVRTCRVTVLDLKNGWTDCAQFWYSDRDQLLGCRESLLEAFTRSSARAGLNLSLARLSKSVLLVPYFICICELRMLPPAQGWILFGTISVMLYATQKGGRGIFVIGGTIKSDFSSLEGAWGLLRASSNYIFLINTWRDFSEGLFVVGERLRASSN